MNIKRSLLLLLPLLCGLSACETPADGSEDIDVQVSQTLLPEEEALLLESEELTGRSSRASFVERIEAVTLKLSERVRGECDDQDNDEQFARVVRTLTNALIRLNPRPSEPEQLSAVVGEWRQVWSDSPFTSANPEICVKADEIYQVVFPDGFYYNLSEVTGGEDTVTGFVRGVYEVTPTFLSVRFTKSFTVTGALDVEPGTITELALGAERGDIVPEVERPVPPIPFVLANVYVNGDFRVVANDPDISKASIVFVLERVK